MTAFLLRGFALPCVLSLGLALATAGGAPAAEEAPATGEPPAADEPGSGDDTDDPQSPVIHDGREYLVPELSEGLFRVDPGTRAFKRRISFNPAYGQLGNERLYVLRGAYNPNSWLGYEISLGHNPGDSVHAVLHTVSAHLRYPLPWRFQPYGTLGYGMMMVYPGESLNSDPVTKNALTAGGGLEVYVRNDVALRFEMRAITILGGESDAGTVAYQYREGTIGLSFYRGLGN